MFMVGPPFWAKKGDPFWSSVLLLVSGDGVNGATSAPDQSSYARSSMAVGSAQLSSLTSTIGYSTSLKFGAGMDRFTYPFALSIPGTSDLTFECFFRLSSTSFGDYYFFQGQSLDSFWFELFSNGSSKLLIANTHGPQQMSASVGVVPDTWYHFAYTRNGATRLQTMYLNGVAVQSYVASSIYPSETFTTATIGNSGTGSASLLGHLQEVRLTTALRYTGNFTPPAEPYPRG